MSTGALGVVRVVTPVCSGLVGTLTKESEP